MAKRKILHILMVGFALLIGRVDDVLIAVICTCAFAFNLFVFPRITQRKFENEADLKLGFSVGMITYPAVLLLTAIIFQKQLVFMLIAWGILAFGDGFSGLVGYYFGTVKIPYNRSKTWLGTLAFAFFATAGTSLLLYQAPQSLWLGVSPSTWICIIALVSLFCAILESIPHLFDDNLIVVLSAASLSFLCYKFYLNHQIPLPPQGFVVAISLLFIAAVVSVMSKKITLLGAFTGAVLGVFLFLGGSFYLLGALLLFFVLGTAASAFDYENKVKHALAQENKGKRTHVNALSNAGFSGFCALWAFLLPQYGMAFMVMSFASFACALSDTLASEIGNAFAKKVYSIVKLKQGTKGADGMISLEGSLAGFIGAFIMACYSLLYFHEVVLAIIVGLSGFMGMLIDSILGATLQKNGFLNNHTVNFFSTVFTGLLSYFLLQFTL